MHVPGLRRNLISIVKCNDHGIEVSFTADGHVNFSRDGHILAQGIRRNNAYFLEGELRSESLWLDPEVCSASVTPMLAHARLGHAGQHVLQHMSSVTDGWPVVGKSNITDCEPCLLGKASRQPFPLGNREPRELCELIHSDLQGPFRIPGIDGSRYSVEFTEHRSRMVVADPIPDKNSHTILEKFHEFKSWIEKLTGKYVKVLRTDRGGEFFGAVYKYLKQEGIQHQTTAAY
jgi:hypothetical protein